MSLRAPVVIPALVAASLVLGLLLAAPSPAAAADGTVTGRVFLDADGDGRRADGELGVAGVSVTATDTDGYEVGTAETTADGTYTLDAVDATTSDLRLRFTPPDGYGDGPSGPDSGTSVQFGSVDGRADLGLVETADPPAGAGVEIGDRVFSDDDLDGVQDAGEVGIAGVTVGLYTGDGRTRLARSVTATDGSYLFSSAARESTAAARHGLDLDPATAYSVRADNAADLAGGGPLDGYTVTYDAADSDGEIDSDATRTGSVIAAPVTIGALGTSDHSVDLGFSPPVFAVGDHLFFDSDRDGLQDADEEPAADVTVELVDLGDDPDGEVVASNSSDPDGRYFFDQLLAGTYAVRFSGFPVGYRLTRADVGDDPTLDSDAVPAGDDAGESAPFELGLDAPNLRPSDPADGIAAPLANDTVDAGLVPFDYAIGDYAWNDADGDGVQDDGELPAPDVRVTLLDADGDDAGRVLGSTSTDADGHYAFDGLEIGVYRLRFTELPTGATFSVREGGEDAELDSDVDPDSGETRAFALGPDEPGTRLVDPEEEVDADAIDPTWDAGLLPSPYAVGDVVWADTDRDGVQDTDEPGVPDVAVSLLAAGGDVVGETVTDAAGRYVFDRIPSGRYSMRFDRIPAGYAITPAGAGTDPLRDSDPDADGVTAAFRLALGAGDVRAAVPSDGVEAGAIEPGIDAGLAPESAAVGDYVWLDTDRDGVQGPTESGAAGVTVEILDPRGDVAGRAVTDADGHYVVDGLDPGTYRARFTDLPDGAVLVPRGSGGDTALDSDPEPGSGVTPTFELGTGAPNNRRPTAADGTAADVVDPTVDAGLVPATFAVGDAVWSDLDADGRHDAEEPGVPDVTVTVLDVGGDERATTTTDAAGRYVLGGLTPGSYTLRFDGLPTGARWTTPAAGDDRGADSDVDAGGTTEPFTLGVGVGGTRVAVTADGVAADYIEPGIDAGVVPLRYAVGDLVWSDTDGDGLHDPDEPGVADVAAILRTPGGVELARTTTDAEGRYVFDELAAGDYRLVLSAPADEVFTPAGAGTRALSLAPGADGVRPTTAADGVEADYVLDSVDAGLVAARFAAAGSAWGDADGDGRQDRSEPGTADLPVSLLAENGTAVASTTTDADGRFVFDELPAGTYAVVDDGVAEISVRAVGDASEPFVLGTAASGIRATTATDGVRADFIRATVGLALTSTAVPSDAPTVSPTRPPVVSPTAPVSADPTRGDAPSTSPTTVPALPGTGGKSLWFILLGVALMIGGVVVGSRGRRR